MEFDTRAPSYRYVKYHIHNAGVIICRPQLYVLTITAYDKFAECFVFQGNKCEVDVRYPGTGCGYRIVVQEYFPLSTSGRQYDATAESPFFNYKVGRST